MGTLTSVIQGRRIFFDSAPLIYYVEQHPEYGGPAEELFGALDTGVAYGGTSVLTLVEVLTQPLQNGREDIARKYRSVLLGAVGVELYPIDGATAERAARLRSRYRGLRTPDALQIASALEHRAELMVTNDEGWRRLTEIRVVLLSDHTKTKR